MKNNLTGGLVVAVLAVLITTMFLANSHIDRAQAKAKAEAIESANTQLWQRVRNLEIKKEKLERELHACQSIKLAPEIKIVTKKIPTTWWLSPQDTVRDTLFSFIGGVTDTLK